MDLYIKLFEVLFPVFFIVAIGYFLGKKNTNFDTSFITSYSANFGTPALVIFALTTTGVTFDVFAVISDGFKTIEFPDDMALIKGINERLTGKFQGVMIRTTPFASYFIYEFDPRSATGVLTFLSLTQLK